MTTCKDCRHWQADPADNGMGECTGLFASRLIEISADTDTLEIYTSENFSCSEGQPIDKT